MAIFSSDGMVIFNNYAMSMVSGHSLLLMQLNLLNHQEEHQIAHE